MLYLPNNWELFTSNHMVLKLTISSFMEQQLPQQSISVCIMNAINMIHCIFAAKNYAFSEITRIAGWQKIYVW